MEEMLLFSSPALVVDREAMVDTEILGHAVPKGTVVICLATGPSMMSSAFDIEPRLRNDLGHSRKDEELRSWNPADIGRFYPERWIVHNEGTGEKFNPAAGPQLAFGVGPRGCPGRRLAVIEGSVGGWVANLVNISSMSAMRFSEN